MIIDQAAVESPARRRRGPARVAAYLLAAVLGLLLLAYAADLAFAGTRLPAGARVASGGTVAAGVPEVDLGGLERADAERVLREAYDPRAAGPLRVSVDGRESTVDPASAGLEFDATATVAEASDPGLLPWRRWQARFGTLVTEPVTRVDEPALQAALEGPSSQVEPAVVHAGIVYAGLEPQVRAPRDGRGVDEAGALAAVRAQWLAGRVVELPVVDVVARGTAEQVSAALDTVGRAAVAAPVALTVDAAAGTASPAAGTPAPAAGTPAPAAGTPAPAGAAGASTAPPAVPPVQLEIVPQAIAPNLVVEVGEDGALVPQVDGDGLRAAAADALAAVERAPADATFAPEGETVTVVPSSDGLTLPPHALADAVESVVLDEAPRTAPVVAEVTAPALTTAEAEALGVVQRVSTFTTEHPCCAPRVTNIHRIADLLDGHLVLPGQEFSLNGTIGERTRANGFVAAPQISEGRFTDGVGGGISQFTTTLFNAVFFAGLEDVQHTPHSYYISRYPAGRESTVSYPEPDFRFRNDSDAAILIDTAYTSRSITVSFYGTKRYDIESVSGPRHNTRSPRTIYDTSRDCEPMSAATGFDITVTRVFKQGGVEVKREDFETTYKAQPRVICGPEPSAVPAPAPSASPSAPAAASPSPAPEPSAQG